MTTDPAVELERLRQAVRHVVDLATHGTPLPQLLHAVVELRRHLPEENR